MPSYRSVMACALCASLSLSHTPAHAQPAGLLNPGFETGDFTGWETAGLTDIGNSFDTFPPILLHPDSTYAAGIFTGDEHPDVFSAGDLEVAFSLTPGTFTSLNLTGGSAIGQFFDLTDATPLSFYCVFATNENVPNDEYNDTAFLIVDGVATPIADTYSTFVLNIFGYHFTDFFLIDLGTLDPGPHLIGFAVLHMVDNQVDSDLVVDSLPGSVFPEPASAALLALAACGLALRRSRSTN